MRGGGEEVETEDHSSACPATRQHSAHIVLTFCSEKDIKERERRKVGEMGNDMEATASQHDKQADQLQRERREGASEQELGQGYCYISHTLTAAQLI